jgi:CNT family concentrative nucleoside transporter
VAWAVSEDRAAARSRSTLRLVIAGLAVHVGLALVLLQVPWLREAILSLNVVVDALSKATTAGTSFVFGYLGGGPVPFEAKYAHLVNVLAFKFLPLMLVISALSALLFHWRILPAVVGGFSWALRKTLGVRGPLGVGAAVNVFVGMVEAPLLVRPYLARMSRGEIFALMTVGLSTIAGTVMVLYATFLANAVPGSLGHILTASILNVPSALIVAALMVPFVDDASDDPVHLPRTDQSTMDALTRGTADGLSLLLNVTAMLLVLVALVALVNIVLSVAPDVAGKPLTLERMMGWLLSPVAWLIGIPWSESADAGALLGTKVVLNELKAYLDMAGTAGAGLSAHTKLILTYAMCGFANFGSVGIMIGGFASMVPERRAEIAALAIKSLGAGLMATLFTGAMIALVG